MSEYSPRLNLPFIQQSQAQKHITHNVAIELLDLLVQLSVEAFDADVPPVLAQEGQIWALGDTPTGAWAGRDRTLAAWAGGGWLFVPPAVGWLASSGTEIRLWDGSAWVTPLPSDMQNLPGVGVNTNHDETNRLAVSAPATLLTHEGSGHQLKINKAAAGETASLLFQTDWSGRAEIGTAGEDDFSVKVSADGSNWNTGLILDRSTGNAVMKQVQATGLTGSAVTQSDADTTAGRLLRTGHRVFPALISAAADTGEVSTAHERAVLASRDCRVHVGNRSAAIASQNTLVTSDLAAALASREGNLSGNFACATLAAGAAGGGVTVSGSNAAAMCGRRFINNQNRSLALGDATSGSPLTSNRTIHLFAETGNVQIAGSLTSSHTFSDFAEMFPNATSVEIPLGTVVTEENGAVRPAGKGDEIAGVVTATAIVTAGDTPFAWQGRYLSDEWGQPITIQIPDPDHEGDRPAPLITTRAENPAWNPDAPQVPRSERPDQWTRVGLLGQVFTRVAEGVMPGDKLSAASGIGVKSTGRTGLRCMTITQPYDESKGYAVARCMINVQV